MLLYRGSMVDINEPIACSKQELNRNLGPRALSQFPKRNFDNGTKSKNIPQMYYKLEKMLEDTNVHQNMIKVVVSNSDPISRKHLGKSFDEGR